MFGFAVRARPLHDCTQRRPYRSLRRLLFLHHLVRIASARIVIVISGVDGR